MTILNKEMMRGCGRHGFDYHYGLYSGNLYDFSVFPQAIKIVKTKQTQDISLTMYSVLTTGVFLWCVYALINHDWPLAFANAVILFLAGWILLLKVRYG